MAPEIEIVDFRARTDRIIYIVKLEGQEYIITNNDPKMDPDQKTLQFKYGDTPVPDRQTFIGILEEGKLTDLLQGRSVKMKGIAHPAEDKAFIRADLYQNSNSSYTFGRIKSIEGFSERVGLLRNLEPLIHSPIEYFAVPHSNAERFRRLYAEIETAKKASEDFISNF